MSKFNETKTNKTTNLAGGKAFNHSSEMELVSAVLTTFLDNKFYEGGDERARRIKGLMQKVNHEFIAKLAIVARREFNLRSVSHLLVAELSRIHRGDSLVSQTLRATTVRPDDLTEIVAYLGKSFPKQIKKGIRRALLKFSPYQLAKYKQGGKKVKLVDLFNIAHPNAKFASLDQAEAWSRLMRGTLKNTETWEARLSSGEDKAKVWRDLIFGEKIGYMALLRNLRNIDKQADEETKKKACEIISNREQVKRSKQLPFRFYNAYENVENRDMLKAISIALDHSVDNVPKFDGKTLVAVDGSGSMSGDPIKKASILAAALMKGNDADLIIYDTEVVRGKFSGLEPTMTLALEIQRKANAGGTDTGLVFQYAEGKGYDRIIILSDNESWGGWDSVDQAYKAFRFNQDPFVYAIDIEGYGTKDINGNAKHICGFSEKIFDFIKYSETGDMVQGINNIEIEDYLDK